MSVIRYEPWALHRDLFTEFNKFFERAAADGSSGATADWVPPVDIEEHADRFVIFADIPGVDPDSIEVTLEQGVLTLSGSRAAREEAQSVERSRSERAVGRFHRRFALPDTADADGVSASGKHGVLEIVIPKRPQVQPRRISVTH